MAYALGFAVIKYDEGLIYLPEYGSKCQADTHGRGMLIVTILSHTEALAVLVANTQERNISALPCVHHRMGSGNVRAVLELYSAIAR